MYINVPCSKEALFLFEILYNENYLDFFYVKKDRIFLKIKYTNGISIIKKISFFSKKGQYKSVLFKTFLSSFNYYHKQAVFNTQDGFKVDSFIKKSKSGGILLFFIKI